MRFNYVAQDNLEFVTVLPSHLTFEKEQWTIINNFQRGRHICVQEQRQERSRGKLQQPAPQGWELARKSLPFHQLRVSSAGVRFPREYGSPKPEV